MSEGTFTICNQKKSTLNSPLFLSILFLSLFNLLPSVAERDLNTDAGITHTRRRGSNDFLASLSVGSHRAPVCKCGRERNRKSRRHEGADTAPPISPAGGLCTSRTWTLDSGLPEPFGRFHQDRNP